MSSSGQLHRLPCLPMTTTLWLPHRLGTRAESGQTLMIPIPVSRVIGTMGTAPAVAAGTMSASATLEFMAFDTASNGTHQLSMNGTPFGASAASATGDWSLRTVAMPIGLLAFPSQAAVGSAPTPSINTVVIKPDLTHTGGCLAVAWARLSFLAMSPVILVHGNGSNGGFFVRRGFVAGLNTAGIPNDSSISLAAAMGGSSVHCRQRRGAADSHSQHRQKLWRQQRAHRCSQQGRT